MRRHLLTVACMIALTVLWTVQVSGQEITVRGRLARTVEAGGWLIISDTDEMTTKYLLLNPQRFRKSSWFRVGAQVEVTGQTKRDAITIYQEGVPFEARTMRPLGSKKVKGKR